MRHVCYFLFFFILCYQSIKGQVPEPMKNIVTPNVSTLGEYGDMPVNMYTGQPNISIPLYDIIEDDIRIPLSLRYDLSNVKPNKHPSWVGMGWNLSCGGQITRVVRGEMDEMQGTNGYASGFYAHRGKLKDLITVEKLKEYQGYFMHDISKDGYELTADEFIFNFAGYSGKFYLNSDGGWTVVSDNDIKVLFDEYSGFINTNELRITAKWAFWAKKEYCNRFFYQFTLVTPDGTKYTFGGRDATEYSISYYNQNNSDLIPTTWFLTRVQNIEGKCVTFKYEAGDPVCELKYTPWEIYRDNIVCSGSSTTGVGYNALSGYLLFPVYLKKIETSFVTVNFYSIVETGDYKQNSLFLALDNKNSVFSPYIGYMGIIPRFDIFFNNIDNTNVRTQQNSILKALNWKRLYAVEIQHTWRNEYYGEETSVDTLGNKTIYFDYSFPGRYKLLSYVTERKGCYKEYSDYQYGGGMAFNVFKVPDYPNDYTPKDYRFLYNIDFTLPEPVYGSEDHWGYWNGSTFSFSNTVSSVITKKVVVYPTQKQKLSRKLSIRQVGKVCLSMS